MVLGKKNELYNLISVYIFSQTTRYFHPSVMVYVHLLPDWNILHIPVSQDRTRRVSYRPFWLFSTHLKCKGRNKFVSLLIMVPVVGKHCYFLKPLGASWLLWTIWAPDLFSKRVYVSKNGYSVTADSGPTDQFDNKNVSNYRPSAD